MTRSLAPAARERRKQDLLLASRLLRVQAVVAADQLAERADRWAERVAQVRALASSPAVRLAGVALLAVMLGRALRRRPSATVAARAGWSSRLVRWGWLGWRAWRIAGPVLLRLLKTG